MTMEQQCPGMSQPMLTLLNDPPVGVPNPHAGASKKAGRNKKAAKKAQCSVPIEEALKTELTANGMKTPISVLQELLSRRGITPQYDLIQVEGAVHEPTFRYRVSYQDKDAMGTGKSKKEAKHAAAKALIEQLTGSPFIDYPDAYAAEKKPDVTNEEEPTANPIGWLLEMCMARRWAPPIYETETEEGLPHERHFTIACMVLKLREVGEGKSKKIAKRQAAQKMWQRLQDQPLEPNQMMALVDEDGIKELRTNIARRYAGLMDVCIPKLTKSQSLNVSQFHKRLKSDMGEYLKRLQGLSMHDINDHIILLAELAKEQQFTVTYVDINEKSFNGMFQCLVQLSSMPVAVCYGCDCTVIKARANAARNTLEYLKIMTEP